MRLPPPGKIVCVGRNYALHARELGSEPPKEPLIFLKPPSALASDGDPILAPAWAGRVDFEGEIGLIIGRRAKAVTAASAWDVVAAVAPVNDVTARSLQRSDDQWSRAKGFDSFCPVGDPTPLEDVDLPNLTVSTRVNDEVRQEGRVAEMIFKPPEVIEYVTRFMTLEPGDLIATGTPAGVGRLADGDVVRVDLSGAGSVANRVVVV